ncbi:site-specific integrase [Flavobacterium chilense]|uniref:Site-specific recombinase XerD n=1 Tax=Flavobacterium chilense TaxID=946677 RepID=A0A1M7ARH7_9FLAO|nr:site-specific integrase [Flavobacterium chilense]SHL45311.1 Site-specific recombinase XerD [Flavobacterium chilense]
MIESSFGLTFFLKVPRKKSNLRYIYLRIIVDGIPKETSTKRRWDMNRWDQKAERAIGSKEDARIINFFLDAIETKINKYRNDLLYAEHPITSQKIIDFVMGRLAPKVKVLEEFLNHNNELRALVDVGEYAIGTHERFEISKKHIKEFLLFKFNLEDMEFRDLNYEFIKDYEFYLKTVKSCNNNTALKYITNFRKIVRRAIDKEIIKEDPFKKFKGKKTKTKKKPLTGIELNKIENHTFSTPRLTVIRDVFIFQCYTGLAYIDAFQLKKEDIKIGIDGEYWIMSDRQKTESATNIPLLPKALEIIEKYKNHPLCLSRGTVLPVKSNQKMNAYLKEIADLCGLNVILNTHKARRTFGSTVTLANDVPIHIVKEMLGHQSVQQTEEYAITEQQTVGRQMIELRNKLNKKAAFDSEDSLLFTLKKLENDILDLKKKIAIKTEKMVDKISFK